MAFHISEAKLAEGRRKGASLGGKALIDKPAPADCPRCQMCGYTRWHQHIGHLGFEAVMRYHPSALHSLREKIRGGSK